MSASAASPSTPRATPWRWLLWGALLALLGLGFVLRWEYLRTISLYVDEFTTLWAAEKVQELGVPRMPSGVLYTRGLLASYVEAAFLTLFGNSYTIGRLPSLLFGLATIAALFLIGRREWHARVGLLAAAGLTLLPEAIIWSGRARFYAQLQFLGLLTVWAVFAALTTQDKTHQKRYLWLFAALFWLALFTQEQMILLYPSLLLAMALWCGWRFLLQPTVLAVNLLCVGGLGVRYLVEKVGQPGYFETIQATRPYVGLIFDITGAWQVYGQLLVEPARLPWTLGALLAVSVAIFLLIRTRSLYGLSRFHQATLFFTLQFTFVFLVMLTLVGTSWRDTRYLYLVQPFWLLCGGAGIVWLIERVAATERVRWAVTAAVAVLLMALLWLPAQRVLAQQVEGYDRVLRFVAEARAPGDIILSPQPPACAQVLGEPCDYYAIQRGYEEYVVGRDGLLIDRWSGAPLLDSAAGLAAAVNGAPGTWFVADSLRLATRYDAAFLRTLVEQFDVAFSERGVLALRAAGLREPPSLSQTRTLATPLTMGPLALTGWERSALEAGASLAVSLFWQGNGPIDRQYNTSLRLVAEDETLIAQADGPPARGIIPTTLFFDTPLPDPKVLDVPADLPPGRYRLDVVAYDVATVEALGAPQTIEWIMLDDDGEMSVGE